MTDKKDPSIENTLLEILGKKMLGQQMTSSALLEKTPDFAENAFRMMGESIQKFALENGLDPLPVTVGAYSRAGPVYGDHTDWSAKVYAHFSLDPIRFIIFCAYQQIELQKEIASLKEDRKRMRIRKDKILDLIRDCKDIDELRENVVGEDCY